MAIAWEVYGYPSALSTHFASRSSIRDPGPAVGHVDLRLAPEALHTATVTIGPLAPAGARPIVESLLSKFAPTGSIRDSELAGTIRRR